MKNAMLLEQQFRLQVGLFDKFDCADRSEPHAFFSRYFGM